MREKETSKCCLTRGPEMQERQSPRWPQPACSLRSPAHSPPALTSQLSDCENGHYLSESCKTAGGVQRGSSVPFHVWTIAVQDETEN